MGPQEADDETSWHEGHGINSGFGYAYGIFHCSHSRLYSSRHSGFLRFSYLTSVANPRPCIIIPSLRRGVFLLSNRLDKFNWGCITERNL